jgi:hypothetical protein
VYFLFEYKDLSDVAKEYQPYIKSINRNKFDYQGIESIDEMKVYELVFVAVLL